MSYSVNDFSLRLTHLRLGIVFAVRIINFDAIDNLNRFQVSGGSRHQSQISGGGAVGQLC